MPWHLPEELRRFRKLTMGKPIVMGRATFDAIGRPLPGRRNIVISRRRGLRIEGCEVVHDPAAALASVADDEEVMVIGGGQIYRQFLTCADRIHLTRVHLEVAGDAFFPPLDPAAWRVVDEECFPAGEARPVGFTCRTLERL